MTTREYKLLLTGSQKLAVAIPILIFTLLPVVFFFMFSSGPFREMKGDNLPLFFPLFPFLMFLGAGAFIAWTVLSLPHTISVTYDKQLVFKSVLSSRTVKISDVISIEPRSLRIQAGISGYLLTHLNGKILFPGQFTGQYLLLYELKQANPSVELKGC
jgi:hypothetical protein